MTDTAFASREEIRRVIAARGRSTRPDPGPAWPDAAHEPIRMSAAWTAFQRKLCRFISTEMGFDSYSVDDWHDPADVETASGDIGTLRVVGSSVFTPEEAARLMELVREAHALGLRVTIGPGDEPEFLTLDFLFT